MKLTKLGFVRSCAALAALLIAAELPRPAAAQTCAAPEPADCCCDGEMCSLVECATCGWYAHLDALALTINRRGATPLVQNSVPGAVVLTGQDLDFPYQLGPRVTLGKNLACGGALEATYFGAMQWSSTATAVDPNNLRIPGALGLAMDDFFGADSITATQQTQLHNVELNLFQPICVPNVSLMAGARYLNFSEQLNLHAVDSDGQESDYRASAANSLLGGQIGGRFERAWDRLVLSAVAKAGVYAAIQNSSTFVGDFNNTVIFRNLGINRTGAAFVGEIGVNGSYFVTDWLAFRSGYNVYFLSGVARGIDQLDFTDTPTSSTTLVNGDAIVHGFSSGIELYW